MGACIGFELYVVHVFMAGKPDVKGSMIIHDNEDRFPTTRELVATRSSLSYGLKRS